MSKHRPRTHWILYDGRACDGKGSGDASVLVSCDDDAEARTYAGDYGDMACYSYTPEEGHDSGPRTVFDERWEWNWLVFGGFSNRPYAYTGHAFETAKASPVAKDPEGEL